MFSKACEYAIKAIIFIARQSLNGRRTNLKEISEGTDSPEAFTAKVLQLLAKNQFIQSQKGAGGGFEMSIDGMKNLVLLAIVRAIDGDKLISECVLGLKECSGVNPCPFHDKYAPVRSDLIRMLSETSIYQLATGSTHGRTFLKN